MVDWPIVRWTIYGRWSDCGRYVYSAAPHVAKYQRDEVIYSDIQPKEKKA